MTNIIYIIAKEEEGALYLKEDMSPDWTESFKDAEKWGSEAQAVSALADMEDQDRGFIYRLEKITVSSNELDGIRDIRLF